MLQFAVKKADLASHEAVRRRLVAAMANADINQTGMAGRLGMKQVQQFQQIVAGTRPGHEHWPRIATLLGCSRDWLLSGSGVTPAWTHTDGEDPAARAEIAALHDMIHDQQRQIAGLKLQLAAKGERPQGQ